jgi:hypothetical protein
MSTLENERINKDTEHDLVFKMFRRWPKRRDDYMNPESESLKQVSN